MGGRPCGPRKSGAASRLFRDLGAEIDEYLQEGGVVVDLEIFAQDFGYKSWRNLERVLYRKGRADLIYRMLPRRKSRQELLRTAKTSRKYAKSARAERTSPERRYRLKGQNG